MKKSLSLLLLALALTVVPATAQAPIQVSLFPPAALVPETESVSGFRLGLYSKNVNVSGLDLGAVTHATGNVTALQVGLVNLVEGNVEGLQLGWGLGGAIANVVRGDLVGAQIALYNQAGNGRGFQWGAINNVEGRMQGLQLSLVNIAEDMNGLQVGLVNIIRSKDRFPILPLVNWKFDN